MACSLICRWLGTTRIVSFQPQIQQVVRYSQQHPVSELPLQKRVCPNSKETALVAIKICNKSPAKSPAKLLPKSPPKFTPKLVKYVKILLGVAGAAGIFVWTFRRVLFDRSSPLFIYETTLKRISADPHVIDLLGKPIKEMLDENGQRSIAYNCSRLEDVPYINMQFLVKGEETEAMVELEMCETSRGKMEYQYLAVQMDCFPYVTLVLEDKRSNTPDALRSRLHDLNFIWQHQFAYFWRR